MITSIVICILYLAILLLLQRRSGIKYTQIIENTHNITHGLLIPVIVGSLLLTIFAFVFNWAPAVFTFQPQVHAWYLWVIPALLLLGAVVRFTHARWHDFDKKGLLFIFFGTLFVGYSEELLVRGIVVHALQQSGFALFWVAILSSVLFGLAHGMNVLTGQSPKITGGQMFTTTLFGFNFFAALIVTGSLWLPIFLHFIHDASLLVQGGAVNDPKAKQSKLDLAIVLALFFTPILVLVATF